MVIAAWAYVWLAHYKPVKSFSTPSPVMPASKISPDHMPDGSNNKPTQKEIFHKVLERLGKTVLRPGSIEASSKLHSWAHLTSQSCILELASGLGCNGIDIAKKYGCKEVWLTDMDEQ